VTTSRLAAASGLRVISQPAADAAWSALVARAQEAWPTIAFDENVLVEFIGARLAGEDLASAIAACPAADLAIAAACAAQEPTAHAAFQIFALRASLVRCSRNMRASPAQSVSAPSSAAATRDSSTVIPTTSTARTFRIYAKPLSRSC
jgi:hypothetical protein